MTVLSHSEKKHEDAMKMGAHNFLLTKNQEVFQEMLDFCGKHNITPEIEIIAPNQVNLAYERVLKSDVRYRFVMDMSKI